MSSSPLSILIIGSGVAGQTTALELRRKLPPNTQIRILERSAAPIASGDFFTVGPSAIKIFRHYPILQAENEKIAYDPWVSYHKHTGECVIPPGPAFVSSGEGGEEPARIYRHHRPKFHHMLFEELERQGIEVEYGRYVVAYFESEAKGGVILKSGEKIEADLVVAADGVGTKSHLLVAGKKIEAKSNGYAIFRTAYPVELALADKEVAERFKLLENGRSVNEIWAG